MQFGEYFRLLFLLHSFFKCLVILVIHRLDTSWKIYEYVSWLKYHLKACLQQKQKKRKYNLLELEKSKVYISWKILFHCNIDQIIMKKDIRFY